MYSEPSFAVPEKPILSEKIREAENIIQFFIARKELEIEEDFFGESDVVSRVIQNGKVFRIWADGVGREDILQYASKHETSEIESFDEMSSFFVSFESYKKREQIH